MPHDIAVIRELVLDAFGDEDLVIFCTDHFPAVGRQFTTGQTQGARVQLLLDYAQRKILLDDLLARVKAANPRRYAEFASRLGTTAAAAPDKPRISIARLPATGPDLFGRERELAALDRAWADPQTHVFSLVAWGGVGKTALVNAWLLALERDGWRGAERVFGWSFYSQGAAEGRQASADPFIDAALRWFGDPDPTTGSPWDKGERLAELVQGRRTLLILDGLEPLQNPPPVEAGRINDPGLRCLLRSLAHGQGGLCVVTTRLPLDDLREFIGATHVQVDLEQLTPEAGAEYLGKLGVRGNLGELREAAAEYGGHALALTLLGGLLADACGGDVRRRHEIGPLEADSQAGGHAARVMAAYEWWFGPGPERAILQMMGLFDRPADDPALAALRAAPPIPGLTDALFRPARSETGPSGKVLFDKTKGPEPQPLGDMDFQRAVAALRRARLLAPRDDARPDELDCHPLVREHFAARLGTEQPAAWQAAHGRLYEHYKTHAKQFPDTLAEMAPLYAAVAHGCQAGRRQNALEEVYWRRIQRGSEFYHAKKLGALGAELALLAGFFDPPWGRPAAGLTEAWQSWVLNEAGFDLRALGRLAEAVEPMRAAVEAKIAREDWKNAAKGAGNLSELALTLGDVARAVAYARQSVELADRSGDAFLQIGLRTTLADALHQAGAVAEAAALFREAEVMQAADQPEFPLLYSLQGYRYCDLLLGQGQSAEVVRRAAKFFEWRLPSDSLLSVALEDLSAGRAYSMLAGESTPRIASDVPGASQVPGTWQLSEEGRGAERGLAASHLDRAVEGLRQAGQQDYLPLGLLARAALRRVAGDMTRSRADLDEALAIAQRGGMKLYEADCHLEAARLHLALNAIEPARASLATAKAMIREMGYGRREGEVAALEKVLGPAL